MNTFAKISVAVRRPFVNLVPKPTPVTYIGAGSIGQVGRLLEGLGAKKTLFILSGTVYRSGKLTPMLADVRGRGILPVVYTGVTPDPTFDGVVQAAKQAAGCDSMVAVGGGSVLDTAKAVSAAATDGGSARRLIGILKVRHAPLPLIMAPTTAGTGSETTVAAVISDPDTHAKKQLLDPRLVPAFAVLDPELTTGLPQRTTAFTAFDALTHALEAAVSTYATRQTDRWADMAVRMISRDLPKALNAPDDLALRQSLLEASFFAGMAFTRVYVGYVHAFAHAIGGRYGVSHGEANAVLLPHVMEYYLPVCKPQFARLARAIGAANAKQNEAEQAQAFVRKLFALAKECGVPERLKQFPAAGVEAVCKEAFAECHGNYPVPRYFTAEAARALLLTVCAKEDK